MIIGHWWILKSNPVDPEGLASKVNGCVLKGAVRTYVLSINQIAIGDALLIGPRSDSGRNDVIVDAWYLSRFACGLLGTDFANGRVTKRPLLPISETVLSWRISNHLRGIWSNIFNLHLVASTIIIGVCPLGDPVYLGLLVVHTELPCVQPGGSLVTVLF